MNTTEITEQIAKIFNGATVTDVKVDSEFGNVTATVNGKINVDCGFIEDYNDQVCKTSKPLEIGSRSFLDKRYSFCARFYSRQGCIIMTRINVVPVQSLTGKHLVSEYRELPRAFPLAHKASQSSKPWTHKQPKQFCMGTGHVTFFYDKLSYLADRHRALTDEMLSRGYKPTFTGSLRDEWQERIPKCYWGGYEANEEALIVNQERIDKRLVGNKGE